MLCFDGKKGDGLMKTMLKPDAVVFTHDKAITVGGVTFFKLADGGPDMCRPIRRRERRCRWGTRTSCGSRGVTTESTGRPEKGL